MGKIQVDVEFKDGAIRMATMHQPLPQFMDIYNNRAEIAKLLSVDEADLLDFPIQKVSCGVPYVIVPLSSLEAVAKVRFRLDVWDDLRDVLKGFVYCFAPFGEQEGSDLHGRMFAPEAGILEDPATGSANGPLGCYVTKYGIKKGPFISEQGFELGRPSIMHIGIDTGPDGTISDVRVGGQSVFVGKGQFFID